jgi:hypothetical protein
VVLVAALQASVKICASLLFVPFFSSGPLLSACRIQQAFFWN